jgi:hypothetical protein
MLHAYFTLSSPAYVFVLSEISLKQLNELHGSGLIELDDALNCTSTEPGRLIAKYYIAFETYQVFKSMMECKTIQTMVLVVLLHVCMV